VSLLVLIIIFTAVGGVLSVMAAAVFLLLPDHRRNAVLPHGISFAIGTFVGLGGELLGQLSARLKHRHHE
jgi:zinc and cadmium transporter